MGICTFPCICEPLSNPDVQACAIMSTTTTLSPVRQDFSAHLQIANTGMQLSIHNDIDTNTHYTTPPSKFDDPFKRAENDRVKCIRFAALTARTSGEIFGLTPPYCPFAPTLLRQTSEELEKQLGTNTGPAAVYIKSPRRKVRLLIPVRPAKVRLQSFPSIFE